MAWETVDPQSDAPPGLGFDPRKTRATDIDPYVYAGEPVRQPRMDIPVATPLPGLAIEPTQRKPGAMVGLAMRINDLLGRQQPAEYAPYQPLPPAAPVITPQEPQPGNWQPVTLEADVGKAALHFGPQVARSAVEGFGDVAQGAGQVAGAASRAGWGPARDYQQVMKALAAKGAGKDVNGVEPTPPLYAPPTEQGYSTADIAKVSGERPAIVTAYEQVGGLLDAAGTGMKQWAGETFPGRQAPTFDAVHDWRSALVYGMESTAQASGSTLPMLTTYMVAGPFAAAIPTYAQSIGQMRASMEEAGLNPKEQDAIILAGGAIMGRVEMMSHGALSALFKEKLGQHVVRRMMSAGGRGGATEGMEEILQEATQIAGEAIAKGENVGLELLSDKGLARMKEAGVGAFVGGFGLGAGGTGGRYAGRALVDQYRAWGEARDRTAAGDTTFSPTDLGQVSIFPERHGDGKADVLAAITVYHGTPHEFEKFDSSKIGTGEGVQAFGHGLYLAESEGVARTYAKPRAAEDFLMYNAHAAYADPEFGSVMRDIEARLAAANKRYDAAAGDPAKQRAIWDNELIPLNREFDALEEEAASKFPFGSVYTVAINAEPHQFLDWDAPWSQQPPQVIEAFANLGMPKAITEPTKDGREPNGATVYGRLEQALEDRMLAKHAEANEGVYPPPPTDYGPDMSHAASEALRSVGIKGARYFDQMSRGKGDGTRNYVVYDDSILDITRKNGKPVDAKTRDAIAAEVAPLSAVSSKVHDARAHAEKFKRWRQQQGTADYINDVKSGRDVVIPKDQVGRLINAIMTSAAHPPSGTKVGVMSMIAHVPPDKAGGRDDVMMVNFVSPYGEDFSFPLTRDFVLSSRAAYIPARTHRNNPAMIVHLALMPESVPDKSIASGQNHEIVHAYRRDNIFSPVHWSALLSHAESLRVLDMQLGTFLSTIGDPTHHLSGDATLRNAYEQRYALRADFEEAMGQESVAHFVELAAHGYWSERELAPVAEILDIYGLAGDATVSMPVGASASSLESPSDMLAAIAQEPRSPLGGISGRDTGYARFEEITRPVYDRSAPVKDSIEKVRLILRDEFGFHDAIINPRGGLDRAEKAIHAYRIISDITGMPKSSIGYRAQVRFGGDKPAIGSASSWNPINALGGLHLGYFKWLPQSTWLGRAKQYVRGKSATTGFGPWSQEVVDMPSAGGVAVHEWAHLFDTHAGQQRSPLRHMAFGGPRSMATAQLFFRKMVNPVYLAAKAVPEPFKSFLKMLGDMRAWDARRTFPWMRPEMARAWEDLIGALREGERSWLDVTRAPIGSLKERISGDAPLDRAKRSGRYISRPWEQFARAFEIYIAQKSVGKYGYEAVEIVGSPEFRGPEYMRVKDPSFSRMMDAFDRIFANIKTDDVTSQPLFAISGRTPTSRSSLVNVLRGFGGIQDVTGDLRAILDRPGTKRYIPGIINKNGLHPDMARERLVEMGYILDDGSLGGEATSTVDDLYDLVRRLANGERVYPRTAEGETERAADEAVLREDENLFAVERVLADLDDYIEKSGLSPLTASERDSAAALIQHNPTPDEMDDLIERLYNETYQAEIEKAYANLTTNEARIAVALQSEGFDRDDAIEQARQIEENRLAAEDIARQKDRGARQDAAGEEPGAGTVGAAGQIPASVGGAGAQGQLNLGSRQTAPGTGGAPPLPGSVPPPLPPGGGRMGPPPLPPSPPPPGAPGNYARALEVVGQQIVPSVKPHWWQNVSWNKFYTRIKDDLHPLAVVRKGLYGKNASVNVDEDFYRLARLTRGSYGLGEHFIRYGTFDYNTRRNTGQSLETILAPVKDDLKSFQSYMVARRSLELSAQGKQTGVPFWAATAVVNGGRAKYEPSFQNILKYQDSLLKYIVDSGLVDPAHAANMRQMHKSYVPFFRLSDETIDQNGPGRNIKTWNPIKRLKGSDKKIIEPIESIVRNTFTYIALAERNRALRAFADGVDRSTAGPQFATKVPPKLEPIHVTDREIDKFLQSYGVAPVGQSMTIFRPRAFTPARDEIAVFRNGKRDVYKVDPEVANAVNGMNAKTVPVLWDLLALPARMLRAGATLAPEFMVRNPVRDQFTALAASRNGYLPVYSFVRGLGHVLKKSGIYQQWLKSGGANSAMVSMDRDYINQQVIRLSDPTFLEKAGNVLRTPIEILRTISEVMENATRVGEFEAGMGRGKDIKESGFDSREVTLDFARMGAQGQAINMIVAFWNAQVEGIDRAVRAFKENPGKFTASMALSITLPSILLWFANKDDPRWKELPAYQRDLFWLIMTNKWRPASKEEADNVPAAYKRQATDGSWEINDGTIWRIPKPFELGILFGSVPERMLDRFYADRPDAFKGFSSSLFGAFLPSFIPQFATPVLEHWGNRSLFLDRALVPKSLEGLEPRYQETPFTSELAKKIGRAIGEVSPDTSIGSPIVIDNYIRAWTGGLGQHVLNMMDAAARKSGISPARIEPSPTLADLPVIKAFVVRYPSASAQSIQDFYDEYERRQKAKASVRYLEKNDRTAEAEELRQSRALVTAEGVHKALAGQHKLARDIYNSKDMTPEEKRRLLDNLYLHMIQIAQRGLESFGVSRAPPRGPAQSASPPNWQPVTPPSPQWQPVAPQSPPSNWQPVVPP